MISVSIFGLGYVGSVAAGCLVKRGCRVIGVDPYVEKVESIRSGRAPFYEPGLDELMKDGIGAGLLSATTDAREAVAASEVSIICVGTPCDDSGALDLCYVEAVTQEIVEEIVSQQKERHVIIFRSTMLPGSTRRIIEEHLAELVGDGRVQVFFFPEFLRQGAAVRDYDEPSLSVVGVPGEPKELAEEFAVLFEPDTAVVDLETAELVKYACNAFHATKVNFANEIGRIGKGLGIDSRGVMNLLVKDTRLNISASYLRPGNPFGGSCLPKDVSALNVLAEQLGLSVPTLGSLIPSNDQHREHLRKLVIDHGAREAVFVGFAFKHGTDDLRGSSLLQLAVDLIADGLQVRIFDPLLDPATMIGASRALVESILPSLPDLMGTTLAGALGEGGVVLASNSCVPTDELKAALTPRHHVIDVSGWAGLDTLGSDYEGICW
ncbi:MAG: GDP-mannose 6-dehydrogenase [Verrucomicrobiales bacterium]|jgi:GDP-mannose 6-dehydrogenase